MSFKFIDENVIKEKKNQKFISMWSSCKHRKKIKQNKYVSKGISQRKTTLNLYMFYFYTVYLLGTFRYLYH